MKNYTSKIKTLSDEELNAVSGGIDIGGLPIPKNTSEGRLYYKCNRAANDECYGLAA